MKRAIPIIITISIIITFLLKFQLNDKKVNEVSKESYPLSAFEQEMLKITDPNTGKVPSGAVWKALKKLIDEDKKLDFSSKKVYPHGWYPVDDFFATLAITKITYDPNQTDHYYFSTGEGWMNADAGKGAGIWKSIDAGKTWAQIPSTDNNDFYYCQDILVHPITSDIYVATRNAGVQRSKDGGLTWQTVLTNGAGASTSRAADLEVTAAGEMFVTMGIFSKDGIYFSQTGDSASWEKRMNGIPSDVYRIEIATAPSNQNIAYCIPTSSGDDRKIKGIFYTDDKGLNWQEFNNPGDEYNLAKTQGWYDLIIVVDPNDEDHIVVGGLDVWRSRNRGWDWERVSQGNRKKDKYMHVDQHEICFVDDNTIMFGNDGGIYKCDNFMDFDPDLYDVNNTYNVTQFYSTAIHPLKNIVLGGTQDNGSLGSTGEGISDFDYLSGSDGSFCAIDGNNGHVFYTTTQYNRVYRTKNGFMDTITNKLAQKESYMFINPIEIDPNNPEILYQPNTEGTWRLKNASTATGNEWEKASRGWSQISAIAISKNIPNIVFIGRTTGNLYKIENALESDGGTVPKPISQNINLTSVYTSCIYVNPKDANHIVVTYSNYGIPSVWETKNGLNDTPDWTSVEGNLPDIPIRWALIHPSNPKVCYLATELGVWFTNELNGKETSWEQSNTGLANVRVDMLRYAPMTNTIVAATHGRGLFTGMIGFNSNEIVWNERGPKNVGGRTRSIMVDPNDATKKKIWAASVSGGLWVINNIDEVKDAVEINDNDYSINTLQNPFGVSGTTVVFNLKNEENVKIDIYTLDGKYMKTIVDKKYGEGVHQIFWKPNFKYATGVYFISLSVDGKQKALKKVLMFDR